MALAQEPTILLLDEPTSILILVTRLKFWSCCENSTARKKVTVVAAMHDLNLAALYFERLVLLGPGLVCADGSPDEVITKEIIQKKYSLLK